MDILAFPQNDRLCVVSVLKEYLRKTKRIRGNEEKLSLSYQKPHKYISKNTLARWPTDVLNGAGVDTKHFSAQSYLRKHYSKYT